MKTSIKLCFMAFLAMTISCKEIDTTKFTEPQPAGMSNLQAIPAKYHGLFSEQGDSLEILVNSRLVLQTYHGDAKIHKNDLSDKESIVDDTLYNRSTGYKMPVVTIGDSLQVHISYTDTIFDIKTDILRKSQGSLFLNRHHADSSWSVRRATLKGEDLEISRVSDEQKSDAYKHLQQVHRDSSSGRYQASRKQFKKFVKNGGFGNTRVFQRVASRV